jgi:RNA polymerase sigma factor (sigma-70 family)
MTKDWTPTKESFDKLLTWLDIDHERAGEKYEHIRGSLIKFFLYRECVQAEALADEVINRVTQKINDLVKTYRGDPARFFIGAARNVLLEYQRKEFTYSLPLTMNEATAPDSEDVSNKDPEDVSNKEDSKFECLDLCMQQISQENRDLILYYYQKDGQAKIDFRKELAEELGIAMNTLRVRVHRLREFLQECLRECLEQHGRA